jgi:hypothetical protein
MNFKSLSNLALAAALTLNVGAFAVEAPAAAGSTAPSAAAVHPAGAASATKASKVRSMNGTVVSSDAIANTLVVKNAKGEETFSVAPAAKITLGKKEIKIADITKDEKVIVKYTEENGAKTASSVKVSMASAKKEEKTTSAAAAQ